MIRLFRLLGRLGLRWMVLGSLARYAARRFGRSTIDRATDDLEARARERLPAPVADLVSSLPVEAKRAGGSAIVAGRAARTAVTTSRRAGQVATVGTRRAVAGAGAFRTVATRLRDESDASARHLRARYLAATEGRDAATDSLLDLRPAELSGGLSAGDESADDPHVGVPDPVLSGRRRSRRRSKPTVDRMRRGYRPALKPWD